MVAGVFGAIIGLLGTAISKWTDIYEKKAESSFQLEIAKSNEKIQQLELDKERIRATSQANVAASQAQAQAAEASAKADAAIMVASYKHAQSESEEDTSAFGQMVRGVLRPLLTLVYSTLFLMVVWYSTTPEIVNAQAAAIFSAFIETSVAITLWWFGLRRGSK